MDNCYCLVRIIPNQAIILYYFNTSGDFTDKIMPTCFTDKRAHYIYKLLCSHQYFSKQISLYHALYLGQELYKAEISLILGQLYIQN